jgi:oxygen-dependent protoporphyrinogen oxidase
MTTDHQVIIIGAGLSGLAAAHFLRKALPEASLLVLEKDSRPGGAIMSFQQQGFLAEWGPHGFLNNTEESLELLKDTGLFEKAQLAPLGNFVRFVCHRGRLMQLPQNPKQLLSSPLLTLGAKLRILGDLFISPLEDDQTIGDWAARRFGRGVLHLIDAAVTGTFAGDFTKLSIDAVMPGLREMEKTHGSVLKAMKKRKKKTNGTSSPLDLPAMVSFPGGMEDLVKTLASDKPIRYGMGVSAISPSDDGWVIQVNGQQLSAASLILALPINNALQLLTPLDRPPVQTVPTARINNVIMGFSNRAKVPYGFGYLAPEAEKRFTMGVMFSSHMFPGRCPENTVLVEALVGGRRHPERLELGDDELVRRVYEDISLLMELPEKPFFTKVLRPASAIPQLEMDHPALLGWRREFCERNTGLYICGFGWDGIGMNEMVKSAKQAAGDLLAGTAGQNQKKDLKPVYF